MSREDPDPNPSPPDEIPLPKLALVKNIALKTDLGWHPLSLFVGLGQAAL